ncbi:hypothetical protein CR513_08518, partial [Mucuna pruriens]
MACLVSSSFTVPLRASPLNKPGVHQHQLDFALDTLLNKATIRTDYCSEIVISGYWVGPDADDGWGFVEAVAVWLSVTNQSFGKLRVSCINEYWKVFKIQLNKVVQTTDGK